MHLRSYNEMTYASRINKKESRTVMTLYFLSELYFVVLLQHIHIYSLWETTLWTTLSSGSYIMTCVLFALALSIPLILADAPSAFRNSRIIPDLISTPPYNQVDVFYKTGFKAEQGNRAQLDEVQSKPDLKWEGDDNLYYTLIMTDPDTPSFIREFLHYLVVNIPGSKVSNGDVFFSYFPPSPPPGAGYKRYVFLVYKQDSKISDNAAPDRRAGFSTSKFAEENNLGNPVYGNFFTVQA
uniref:OV-16 antigen n=1 Tax=Steinernema glaseri TaxID=37863 RepID=A0A1I7Z8X4_9BILA